MIDAPFPKNLCALPNRIVLLDFHARYVRRVRRGRHLGFELLRSREILSHVGFSTRYWALKLNTSAFDPTVLLLWILVLKLEVGSYGSRTIDTTPNCPVVGCTRDSLACLPAFCYGLRLLLAPRYNVGLPVVSVLCREPLLKPCN